MSFNQYEIKPGNKTKRFIHVGVPMRDGVKLSADIILPTGPGPFPVILQRTPYDNSNPWVVAGAVQWATHGYAYVLQDVRGRGDSDGQWHPFVNEDKDGFDTVEWVAEQPWCTGKVALIGFSYTAHTLWMAAKENPPHLAALVSCVSPGRWGIDDGMPYTNGIRGIWDIYWLFMTHGRTLQTTIQAYVGLGVAPLQINWPELVYHLPLSTMDEAVGYYEPWWHDTLENVGDDGFYDKLRVDGKLAELNVPGLHATGWFDSCLIPTIHNYQRMVAESKAPDKQMLVVGPWYHLNVGRKGLGPSTEELYGLDLGTESAMVDAYELTVKFLDYYLKGKGTLDIPKVQVFAMGENKWHTEKSWPVPVQKRAYYLDSDGQANTLKGNGKLGTEGPIGAAVDNYTYDPADPTPAWPNHREKWHGHEIDQRWVQERQDVLVYTSDILRQPVAVVGRPRAELLISSDAPDTDLFVTLCDVYPDGRAIRIAFSGMRTRFRESLREEKLMITGRVYQLQFDLPPVYNVFLPGHCIQVDIRSANFPWCTRNLNTGKPIADDTEIRVAHNTVHHNRKHASRILLPMISG